MSRFAEPLWVLRKAVPAESLAFLRIWIFGLWFLKVALDPFDRLGYLPAPAFTPMGLLNLLPHAYWVWLIDPVRLRIFRAGLAVLLLLATLGAGTRFVLAVACLLLLYYQGLVRAVGHFNHAELLLLYSAGILALSPCEDALAVGSRRNRKNGTEARYGFPIALMTAALVTSYCFVGAHRLAYGGAALFRSDAMVYWTVVQNYGNTEYGWSIGLRLVANPYFALAGKYSFPLVTAFEVLAPIALVAGGFRRLWIPAILAFHLGALILLKVSFWEEAALFVVFADTSAWRQTAARLAGQLTHRPDAGSPKTRISSPSG
jgi:hypothetical protein